MQDTLTSPDLESRHYYWTTAMLNISICPSSNWVPKNWTKWWIGFAVLEIQSADRFSLHLPQERKSVVQANYKKMQKELVKKCFIPLLHARNALAKFWQWIGKFWKHGVHLCVDRVISTWNQLIDLKRAKKHNNDTRRKSFEREQLKFQLKHKTLNFGIRLPQTNFCHINFWKTREVFRLSFDIKRVCNIWFLRGNCNALVFFHATLCRWPRTLQDLSTAQCRFTVSSSLRFNLSDIIRRTNKYSVNVVLLIGRYDR